MATLRGRRLVVGATAYPPEGNRFALLAFRARGQVARRFGSGGLVLGPYGELGDLAQQADGKIVAAGGSVYQQTRSAFTLARYR